MRHLLKIGLLVSAFFIVAIVVRRFANKDLFLVFVCFSISLQILHFALDRFAQKHHLLKMKKEALHAELALLKNQINPHFFFNTLNNLYALALNKSEQTATLIFKLSELMRFTIYEGKKDHVPLEDEVAYLENYVDIQAIRSRHQKVDLQFEKEISDGSVQVPPLLFIMLVENAFKHGVSSVTGHAFVRMHLRADQKNVRFEIENNYEAKPKKGTPGIGLANMQRRLAILFPNKHRYQTRADDGLYNAILELEL